MLTQKNINDIRKIVREEIKVDSTHPTKDEFYTKLAGLEEKIQYLPTKDDFYNKMDELMGEVKAMSRLFLTKL